MKHLGEGELLQELKRRFEENRSTLKELHTAQEKLQEINRKLMDSEALKGHFLSNIRNEINNPLTAILGLAQNLMAERDIDAAAVNEMAGLIYSEAFDLDFQLRKIFAAAEIEAGEAYLHVSRVDIAQLILRTVKSFSHAAQKNGLGISTDIDLPGGKEDSFLFPADSEKLYLIFSNMLSNAVEYGRGGKKVEVHIRGDYEKLEMSVQDYGIGIDKKDYERIFDRFVQLDQGLTKEFKGHGLGLSVIRNTVDFLDGEISLTSTKGQGSVFSVTLPAAQSGDDEASFSSDGNEELF